MTTVLSFIFNYWYLIIVAIALIAVASIKIYVWLKTPGKEQLNKIQQWLIWAVAQAEKELGSGTGQMKIRYVYDLFISKFPSVAIFIKYETFANMVEKALAEFKEMIESNRRISEEFASSYDQDNDLSGIEKDEEEIIGGPDDE